MAKKKTSVLSNYKPDLDIQNATVRIRYFQGRSELDIATDTPIPWLTSPYLPAKLPVDIIRAATASSDMDSPAVAKSPFNPGPYFHAIVRSCLYTFGFPMQVKFDEEKTENVTIIPGYHYGKRMYGPDTDAKFMVVGKCHGEQEAATGIPFSGKTSHTLWDAWAQVGLPDRDAINLYAVNVVRFCPPSYAMQKMPAHWKNDGAYLLKSDIILSRPKWILVLGADALKALIPAAKISDYKGRVGELVVDARPHPDYPPDEFTVKFVACDHPANVARDPDLYPSFVNSLRFFKERAAEDLGVKVDVQTDADLDYKAIYTIEELEKEIDISIKESADGGYISFDGEWEGESLDEPGSYIYTMQWSHGPDHARSAFLHRCGGAVNPDLPIRKAIPLFQKLLEDAPSRGAKLVAHFGKADLPQLKSLGIDLYDKYVVADDDEDPDGVERLFGFQKQYFCGAHDTAPGAHVLDEASELGLKILCSNTFGMERWDVPILNWKEEVKAECKRTKTKFQINGFGNVPEEIIGIYGGKDAMYTGRLYLYQNGNPKLGTKGALDKDSKGNDCRQVYWTRMASYSVWAEMEKHGILIDAEEQRKTAELLDKGRVELLTKFQTAVNWPYQDEKHKGFEPSKKRHTIDILFGEEYLPKQIPIAPPDALRLYLKPFKATDTHKGDLWDKALARTALENLPNPTPSTDKETIIALLSANPDCTPLQILFDTNAIVTPLRSTFRLPKLVEVGEDEDAEEIHEKGLMSHCRASGRVHSRFGWTETGRGTSKEPNCQNFGGSVDEKINDVLNRLWGTKGIEYVNTRKVVIAPPGHLLVNADLKGAEIAVAAWVSNDELLMEHVELSTQGKLDLHSDLAKRSFSLDCDLKDVKKLYPHLRTAAKRTRFGHYYGSGIDGILRKVQEEDPRVTRDQIVAIVQGHDQAYPNLASTFAGARRRAKTPGWLCTPHGAFRRAKPTTDRELAAAQEREFQNFICQNPVAETINLAMYNLRKERARRGMRFQIILSVHDSISFYAPYDEVVELVDEVIPACMVKGVPFVPTDFDGIPVGRGPYYFAVDVEVGRNWGEALEESEWRSLCA